MKVDSVQEFVALRENLLKRKAELEAELAAISEALGVPAARPSSGAPRAQNSISLKQAVLNVIKDQPMAKQEILEGVLAQGYQFSAKNPMGSLNTLLYSDKTFKNHGEGRFGPA